MSFVFFEGEKRIVENGSKLNSGDKSSLTNYFEKRFSLFLLCVSSSQGCEMESGRITGNGSFLRCSAIEKR